MIISRWLARQQVRRLLARDAVIVDTETTDLSGAVVEIAVVDATSGTVLLDTLVNPQRPIAAAAAAIHGITAAEVQQAPSWDEVAQRFHDIVGRRPIIAYNAPFDRAIITTNTIDGPRLWPSSQWACAMRLRAKANGDKTFRRLDGGHRALSDCIATQRILAAIAETPFSELTATRSAQSGTGELFTPTAP